VPAVCSEGHTTPGSAERHSPALQNHLSDVQMPRPPNYKQEKKRREEDKRRRNAQAEQRKAEKKAANTPAAAEATERTDSEMP
jgi:hypothetical protein